MKLLFTTLLALTLLTGMRPSPRSLDARSYLEWYHSAAYPYRDTVEAGSIKYICSWVPSEVELARDILQNSPDKKDIRSRYKEVSEEMHFQLSILLPHSGTDVFTYDLQKEETTSSRTQYFAFQMQKDLRLKTLDGDSVKSLAFIQERGLSNHPVSRFDIYFPLPDKGLTDEFIFYDRIFTHKTIAFPFKEKFKNKLPKLNIQ